MLYCDCDSVFHSTFIEYSLPIKLYCHVVKCASFNIFLLEYHVLIRKGK